MLFYNIKTIPIKDPITKQRLQKITMTDEKDFPNLFNNFFDTEIPVVYEHHSPLKKSQAGMSNIDKDKIIGVASGIRFNDKDELICDVMIHGHDELSSHWEGVLDNISIKIVNKTGKNDTMLEIAKFIVYDKEVKENVRKSGK